MKTVVEEIDAKKAQLYLESNPEFESGKKGTNRPISWRWVNNLAKDMLNENWMLTHQGIAFDTDGQLKDGQHRLLAVIQATEEGATDGEHELSPNPKLKVQFRVTHGVDPNTFDVIDVGRTRTSSQILAMGGHINTVQLAAAGRLLYLYDHYEYTHWRKTKVPGHAVLDYVNKVKLANYASIGQSLFNVGFITSAVTAGYYVCRRALPSGPHNEYIEGLKTGEDLRSEDPRLALRNYMIRSKGGTNPRRDSFLHLALYIKGWNDFVNNRRRSMVTWRVNESFPSPVEKINVETTDVE